MSWNSHCKCLGPYMVRRYSGSTLHQVIQVGICHYKCKLEHGYKSYNIHEMYRICMQHDVCCHANTCVSQVFEPSCTFVAQLQAHGKRFTHMHMHALADTSTHVHGVAIAYSLANSSAATGHHRSCLPQPQACAWSFTVSVVSRGAWRHQACLPLLEDTLSVMLELKARHARSLCLHVGVAMV